MITIEYRCADGTPFPVVFEEAADAEIQWGYDREHTRDAMTPLAVALNLLGHPGGERAYTESGLERPGMFRTGPRAHGFSYSPRVDMSPEAMQALVEGSRKLIEKYGSAEGIWHDLCLGKVRAACDEVEAAPLDVPLARVSELQQYALHLTMVPVMVSFNDVMLMTAVLNDLYGETAGIVAYELTQGYPNETVRADQHLWRIGRLLGTSPALVSAVDADDPTAAMEKLRASGDHAPFFAQLDEFLALYGRRSESWEVAAPTWKEQSAGFWAQVRQMARDDVVAPDEALAQAAKRREALATEIEGKLQDEQTRGRFQRRAARLASYVAVREERALWQLISIGALRNATLRRGAALAERAVFDSPADIFFLLPEEVEEPVGDLRSVVAERRAEHEHWLKVTPPAVIGRGAPTEAAASGAAASVVKGSAGARGVATGRARVVIDLADADRVAPGDVLVCVMTAPPWTPLFAIASAVVTDSGSISSHPAIAAREYGIPCVVGTGAATTQIPDGAMVTVDGSAGTVTLAS